MLNRPMMTDADAFLADLEPDFRKTVETLRAQIFRIVPDIAESVAWSGLSYHRPSVGGRVKGAVCQIVVKRGEVRLDFIHGIRLADPRRLLQGSRLSKRFVHRKPRRRNAQRNRGADSKRRLARS